MDPSRPSLRCNSIPWPHTGWLGWDHWQPEELARGRPSKGCSSDRNDDGRCLSSETPCQRFLLFLLRSESSERFQESIKQGGFASPPASPHSSLRPKYAR